MHTENLEPWTHTHEFAVVDATNERRTAAVVWLTAAMMVVEVAAGFLYGSMALLADGWHMGTHVAALGISVLAYRYARQHAADPRFTFGTGKVGVLGGFTSAIALALVAFLMIAESVHRFVIKPSIRFDEAIAVALTGLAVNIASAIVLSGGRAHRHAGASRAGLSRGGQEAGREAGHGAGFDAHNHGPSTHTHDHNLRAAYLHVVADALTSVLAVIALTAGKVFHQVWLDPLMGMVGGAVIARWSYGLISETGRILLDAPVQTDLLESVRSAIESVEDNRLADLHIWKVGPDSYAAILCVVTGRPRPPDYYRSLLAHIEGLSHVSIEVQICSECARPQ